MHLTTKRPDRLRPAALAALGGAAALALLWLSGSAEAPAPAPAPSMPPAAAPAPTPAAATAAPAPSADGLRLYGLLGSGAIVGLLDGSQRWVPVGRDVVPGLRLAEVRQHRAVLVSSGGTFELTFDGARAAAAAAAPAAAPAADPHREETLRYRLGLAPQRANGRIAGFAIRPGADLPTLRRAGLRPGDVLVRVNGQTFDSEERVQELSREIAGSFTAEFEFLRNGRRMRTSLEINPRN